MESRPWLLRLRASESFLVFLVTVAVFTDIFLYSIIIPMLPKSLVIRAGVPERDVQYWVSILLGTYGGTLLIGSALFGYFADHYKSRRLPFVLGLLSLAASTTLFAVAVSPLALMFARGFQGISASAVWVVGLAWIVDNVAQDQVGEAMGSVAMAMSLGYLVGPIVGGVMYERLGYYSLFVLPAILIIVQVALQFTLIEKSVAERWLHETQDPECQNTHSAPGPAANSTEETPLLANGSGANNASQATIFHLLRSSRLLIAMLTIAIATVMQCALETILPLFVIESYHWQASGAGLIFLAISLPTLAGAPAGKVVDRLGSRGPGSVSFLVAGVTIFFLRFTGHNDILHKILLCGLLAFVGLALLVIEIIAMTEVFEAVQDFKAYQAGISSGQSPYAQAYGLFTMAAAVGQLSGPMLGGFLQIYMGWSGVTLMCGIICGFAAAMVGCLSGSRSDREEDDE